MNAVTGGIHVRGNGKMGREGMRKREREREREMKGEQVEKWSTRMRARSLS